MLAQIVSVRSSDQRIQVVLNDNIIPASGRTLLGFIVFDASKGFSIALILLLIIMTVLVDDNYMAESKTACSSLSEPLQSVSKRDIQVISYMQMPELCYLIIYRF